MLTSPPVQLTLTQEQEAVALAPAFSCQLVISGPGTGKTFTLVRRLQYLITEGGLEPNQIVVLSFSRAAVREIVNRVESAIRDKNVHDDLRYLTVRTFDSFAYSLLEATGEIPDLINNTYDDNIGRAAIAIDKEESEARDIIAGISHIIVDEVQDLVGPRARLVQAILQASEGGFTLLGDPAQAIYDYQVREKGNPSASEFLNWVQQLNHDWQLEVRHLSKNLRAKENCFAVADKYRPLILASNSRSLELLSEALKSLPSAGKVADAGLELKNISSGRTAAILCRTNNEALNVHNYLRKQNIPHVLAADTDNIGLPPWIARVFSTWTERDISLSDFEDRWNEMVGKKANISSDRAWTILQKVMLKPSGNQHIKIAELKKRLAGRTDLINSGNIDDGPESILTVSTIHRAKGREYDLVAILDVELRQDEESPLEESRVLYVAATRPRVQLCSFSRTGLHYLSSVSSTGGKSRNYSRSQYGDLFIEIGLPGDLQDLSPVSLNLFETPAEASQVQDYLWHTLRAEDDVRLWYNREGYKNRYYIQTTTEPRLILGEMSADFGRDMCNFSYHQAHYRHPLDYLEAARVSNIRSVILPGSQPGLQAPYGQTGIFLSLRLQGMVFAGKVARGKK